MQTNLLDSWKDEYLKVDETYRNHVTKFVAYITSIGKGNHPIGISKEDVIECVGYYNKIGKINTVKTMESHLESIKAFYKYIVGRQYSDDIFNNIASFQEFKEKIVIKYNLSSPKNRTYWDESELIDILEMLDGYFDRINLKNMNGLNERKNYFKFLVLRLFIKLTLVAPAKKNVICSITKKNFDPDFRTLEINGVKVRIPNGLARDIKFSINIGEQNRNVIISEDDNIFEFVYNDNFRTAGLNEFFCTFLKTFRIIDISNNVSSYPIEIIMDTALYEMVKNGANPALIAKINGTKLSALEKKFYSNNIAIYNADDLINQEIAKNKYYNYI